MDEAIGLVFNRPNYVDLPRLPDETSGEVLELLADYTDDAKTVRAVALLADAYNVAVDVQFYGERKVPDLKKDQRTVLAYTNGRTIFIDRLTQTPEFISGRLQLGPQYAFPAGTNQYQAVVLHEFGHVLHWNPATSGVFRPLWISFLEKTLRGRVPTLLEMREFEETVAATFATSVFADAGLVQFYPLPPSPWLGSRVCGTCRVDAVGDGLPSPGFICQREAFTNTLTNEISEDNVDWVLANFSTVNPEQMSAVFPRLEFQTPYRLRDDAEFRAKLKRGMQVELEHGLADGALGLDVTGNNAMKTAQIALAHLLESPTYYEDLADLEQLYEAGGTRAPENILRPIETPRKD